MELRDVRLALRRNWLVAALTVICFTGAGVFGANLPAKKYTAKATLTVNPGSSTNGVESANYLLPTFVTVVSTSNFLARVQQLLPPNLADDAVTLSASNPSGTGLIEVSAKSPSATSAAAWATAAATTLTTDPSVPLDQLVLRVIQAPGVPSVPSSPKPLPVEVASVLLGIIAAVFVALMAEWLRRQSDNPTLARERLGAPVLSIFPKVRRLGSPKRRLPDILTDWSSDFAERAQELRTNVEVALVGRNVSVIAVIGPEPGEGATTVAATLAMTLSRVGYRVIAVDADLRAPRLDEQLGIAGTPGLGEVADGARVPAQPGPVPGLEVVPAGTSERHPAEVLRLALATVLESAPAGTIVIVDCPPLRDAAENAFILSVCGTAIVVVNARRLRSKRVEWVGEQMSRSDCELLGVVINRRAVRQGRRHAIGRSTRVRRLSPAASGSGLPQVSSFPSDEAFLPGSGTDGPVLLEPIAGQDQTDQAAARPGQIRVSSRATRSVKSESEEATSAIAKRRATQT